MAFPGIVRHFHIHRANFFALSAGYALVLVALDPDGGEIAHGLQQDGDGTDVFAKGPIILEVEGQNNPHGIIQKVAAKKAPEHDTFKPSDPHKKEARHKQEGKRKYDVTDEAQFPARRLRDFIRQKIQHHRRPAGVPAPAAPEDQRPENLRHSVMDRRRLKNAGKQVVPKALDLHILIADQSEIYQHIQAHKKLYDPPSVLVAPQKQEDPKSQRTTYVTEIQQIEKIAFHLP